MSNNPLEYCDHGLEASEGLESNGWWEYDARGIELCKVCDLCREVKLAKYRPDVLTNPGYECDEDIDPEPGVFG